MDGSGTHAMPARSMRARSGLWILVRDAMRGRRDEERGAVPFKVACGRGRVAIANDRARAIINRVVDWFHASPAPAARKWHSQPSP
jgi:hypothetical protein